MSNRILEDLPGMPLVQKGEFIKTDEESWVAINAIAEICVEYQGNETKKEDDYKIQVILNTADFWLPNCDDKRKPHRYQNHYNQINEQHRRDIFRGTRKKCDWLVQRIMTPKHPIQRKVIFEELKDSPDVPIVRYYDFIETMEDTWVSLNAISEVCIEYQGSDVKEEDDYDVQLILNSTDFWLPTSEERKIALEHKNFYNQMSDQRRRDVFRGTHKECELIVDQIIS